MRLKELRLKRGLTQQNIADFLTINVVNYSRYESGDRQIPIAILKKLADYYQVSVDYLVGRNGLDRQDLTSAEEKLLFAYRNADDRARADSYNILLLHGSQDEVHRI